MFPLLDLQVELIEEVLRHCMRSDLKAVSQCSRSLNQLSNKILWQRVKIPWKCLIDIKWRDTVTAKQIENLRYTKSVAFYDRPSDVDRWNLDSHCDKFYDLFQNNWTLSAAKRLMISYRKLLDHFDPTKVEEFKVKRGCGVIYYASLAFPYLKKVILEGTLDIAPPIDEFSDSDPRDDIDYLDPFKAIGNLKALHELDLSHNIIEDEDQEVLFEDNSLEELRVLNLADCNSRMICCSLYFPQLVELNLWDTKIQDAALSLIKPMPTLRSLNIGSPWITDLGILELLKFQNLEMLSLRCCEVTNVGVKHLVAIETLRMVDLSATRITDEAISYFEKVPHLKALLLNNCAFLSDGCIPALLNLRFLMYLEIDCSDWCKVHILSVQAVEQLLSHPSLKRLKTSYKRDLFEASSGNIEFPKDTLHYHEKLWRISHKECVLK